MTVLLYNGPLICGFNVPINKLIDKKFAAALRGTDTIIVYNTMQYISQWQ